MSKLINRKYWLNKLLVEGKDDKYVVTSIRDGHGVADNFEIVDCEGVENIVDKLIGFVKAKQHIIGIIVDADDKLHARWESLKSTLIDQGYEVPKRFNKDGTIIPSVGRNPKIGIWLMPDNNQEPGMLEHFVATLIPESDKLKDKAEQILDELESEKINNYRLIHRSKALIHTWLAWQEEPGKPMGLAITQTYLDHNTELCQRFADWLKKLYTDDQQI